MTKDKVKQKGKLPAPPKSAEDKVKPVSGIWKDERFQHLVSDPRFKGLPKVQRKVKIDKRFQGMFTNDKFKVKYTVDKYGRRVNKSNAEDLRKYYELNSSDEEKEDEEKAHKEKKHIKEDDAEDADSESGSDDEQNEREAEEKVLLKESEKEPVAVDENDALTSDDEEVPKTLRARLVDPNIDYARGEGRLITDSSSDDESSEDDDPELLIDHVWGELDNDAETTDESTKRLAVCNMDWDRVRATDLMVLFSSFLPPGGSILSVKIYPSEYGKERLKEEEEHGPPELVGLSKDNKQKGKSRNQDSSSDSDSEDDLVKDQDSDAGEGDDYHMEKLRQYQLNRLRYYYAVVECDSVPTADKIYKECDGIEYESSATKVDLRFISDDTTFDEDKPIDMSTDMPDGNSYKPRQFITTALQQAKVDLTWDETAVDRKELGDKLSAGKMEGISDKDLRKIVAYSSEEYEEDSVEEEQEEDLSKKSTEDEIKTEEVKVKESKITKKEKKLKKKEKTINKYRALLAEINEKEQKEKEKKNYEMEFSWEVNDTSQDAKDKGEEDLSAKNKSNLTPIERALLKRSEKNKKRKEERKKKKQQSNGDEDDDDLDSDVDSLPDGVDLNDPYFAEEFANGDFVDPKVKLKEKQKKHQQKKIEQDEEDEMKAKELELLLDDNEEDKQHFSLEKILKSEQATKSKKKRKKQLKKSKAAIENLQKPVEDNFQINLNDERFKSVFTSHEFNIDPSDSHFKKTKGMEQFIHEKLKRRHNNDGNKMEKTENEEMQNAKKPKKHLETSMLVKSLKRKIHLQQGGK